MKAISPDVLLLPSTIAEELVVVFGLMADQTRHRNHIVHPLPYQPDNIANYVDVPIAA